MTHTPPPIRQGDVLLLDPVALQPHSGAEVLCLDEGWSIKGKRYLVVLSVSVAMDLVTIVPVASTNGLGRVEVRRCERVGDAAWKEPPCYAMRRVWRCTLHSAVLAVEDRTWPACRNRITALALGRLLHELGGVENRRTNDMEGGRRSPKRDVAAMLKSLKRFHEMNRRRRRRKPRSAKQALEDTERKLYQTKVLVLAVDAAKTLRPTGVWYPEAGRYPPARRLLPSMLKALRALCPEGRSLLERAAELEFTIPPPPADQRPLTHAYTDALAGNQMPYEGKEYALELARFLVSYNRSPFESESPRDATIAKELPKMYWALHELCREGECDTYDDEVQRLLKRGRALGLTSDTFEEPPGGLPA